eukprot:scaffold1894_cov368-Prasinococcus_capsulatus_cf.AAC.12
MLVESEVLAVALQVLLHLRGKRKVLRRGVLPIAVTILPREVREAARELGQVGAHSRPRVTSLLVPQATHSVRVPAGRQRAT